MIHFFCLGACNNKAQEQLFLLQAQVYPERGVERAPEQGASEGARERERAKGAFLSPL